MGAPPLDYVSPQDAGRRRTRWFRQRLSRWHAWVAVVAWLVFSALTLLIVLSALDRAADKPRTVAATTAATILGPMTGAVSRDFQGCCVESSLGLLPYCLGALLFGLAVQLLVPPRGWVSGTVRVTAWTGGLFVWFGGGIASFAHALS